MSKPIFWTPEREAQYKTDWLTMTDNDLSTKYGMSKRSIGNINHRFQLTNRQGRLTKSHRHSKYTIGDVVSYQLTNGDTVEYLMTESGRERINKARKPKPTKIILPKIKPQPQQQAKIKPEKKVKAVVPKEVRKPVFMPPRRVEKVFKNVDHSDEIPVRIDHRTTVFVKPGTDIEAIKAKYKRA
jgi:hypothetical protein